MADQQALREFAEAEQTEFAELTRSLGPEEWDSPSLCRGWDVRDVIAHSAIHIHRALLPAVAGTQKAQEREMDRARAMGSDRLADWLAAPITAKPLGVQLAELMIHQQDVRRPLGRDRIVPPERTTVVLDECLTRVGSLVIGGARKHTKGLRFVATDAEWSWGTGSEVSGPSEAILMAVHGRSTALDGLQGEGVDRLAGAIG